MDIIREMTTGKAYEVIDHWMGLHGLRDFLTVDDQGNLVIFTEFKTFTGFTTGDDGYGFPQMKIHWTKLYAIRVGNIEGVFKPMRIKE